MTKKLIIDTDVGIDDAIAILMALADPEWQIVGICGVSGNVGLDHVMRNIGIVLDAAGANPTPIFRGASRPLLAPPHPHDPARRNPPRAGVARGLRRAARDRNPGGDRHRALHRATDRWV